MASLTINSDGEVATGLLRYQVAEMAGSNGEYLVIDDDGACVHRASTEAGAYGWLCCKILHDWE